VNNDAPRLGREADAPFRPFTAEQIALARSRALASQRAVVDCLDDDEQGDANVLVQRLARTFSLPHARMSDLQAWSPAFDLLPYTECARRQCILFRDAATGALSLVIADPFEGNAFAWADARLEETFTTYLAHPADIQAYLGHHEESMSAMASALPSAAATTRGNADVEELSIAAIAQDTSPVVRLVRSTLYDALKGGASDIHLETDPGALVIKYRIDGVLNQIGRIQGVELAEQMISRIKVMSDLDIAERRVPQDGRFKAGLRGREIDFRVSIMPSVFGEDAVLRILDKQSIADAAKGLTLDSLGFDGPAKDAIRALAAEPYGMLLVTGPTGSGKTTTLYAAITEMNHGRDKIVTIEDPVEYQLPGVLQIPVNEKKGLTFARGLRSILRHDPDRVMVGEIRDAETAQIAVQAALTGHLVFTTVHANNVFDVLGRFTHMNVDPHSFVAALNGIVAQRLVRVNCPHCVTDRPPAPELIAKSGLSEADLDRFRFRSGAGCGQCRGTGYKGRRAIAEILLVNDEIRELIIAREPIRKLKAAAVKGGTRFLREDAIALVQAGITDLAEVNRVTFVR
jgi:general secretion pathway protein E